MELRTLHVQGFCSRGIVVGPPECWGNVGANGHACLPDPSPRSSHSRAEAERSATSSMEAVISSYVILKYAHGDVAPEDVEAIRRIVSRLPAARDLVRVSRETE
jgi:hypothetical protein